MQRLFTALSLPEKTAEQLSILQPVAGGPVRAVETAQLHITLHFIGQADTSKLADILRQVQAPAFSLQIEGLGKFEANGAFVLWAGVQKNEGLMTLYQKIAAVLSAHGYPGVSMNYIPHITLARCKNGTPNSLDDKFLNQAMPPFKPLTMTEFGLYSSNLYNGKPIYRCERTFSLKLS